MARNIIIADSVHLTRVLPEHVTYVQSDGSYSTMFLTGGRQRTFSFNLAAFESLLEHQLGNDAEMFVRLGKSLIVNINHIYSIDLTRQELILTDETQSANDIKLTASREALRSLKSMIEAGIRKRRLGL